MRTTLSPKQKHLQNDAVVNFSENDLAQEVARLEALLKDGDLAGRDISRLESVREALKKINALKIPSPQQMIESGAAVAENLAVTTLAAMHALEAGGAGSGAFTKATGDLVADSASKKAELQSRYARRDGTRESHVAAADQHFEAARLHSATGNDAKAIFHFGKAGEHYRTARDIPPAPAASATIPLVTA